MQRPRPFTFCGSAPDVFPIVTLCAKATDALTFDDEPDQGRDAGPERSTSPSPRILKVRTRKVRSGSRRSRAHVGLSVPVLRCDSHCPPASTTHAQKSLVPAGRPVRRCRRGSAAPRSAIPMPTRCCPNRRRARCAAACSPPGSGATTGPSKGKRAGVAAAGGEAAEGSPRRSRTRRRAARMRHRPRRRLPPPSDSVCASRWGICGLRRRAEICEPADRFSPVRHGAAAWPRLHLDHAAHGRPAATHPRPAISNSARTARRSGS